MDKSLFSYFLILIFCLSFGTLTNFHVNEQKNVTSGLSSISDTNNKNIFEKSYQTSSYLSSIRDIVGINQLLNLGYNGSGVTVGIIDSGVNSNLSPFSNRILDSKSFVSTIYGYNTNITSTDDVDDHGTRVASLIMADSIGMAPAANLVSAKLFNGATSAHPGFSGEESSSAVAAAIKWLVDVKNVSIINLSIGQYNNLAREGREYWIDKYSLEKNVIFTISAGNEGYYGYNGGSTGNPAISLQAITVGASGDNSGLAYFSSIGPRYDNAFKPDVVAPGVSVNTLLSSGSYGPGSGTSFSAPIVAGVAATLISALKKLSLTYTPGTIKGALIKTATPILDPSSSYEPYPWWEQGAGLINATAALEYLISTTKTNSTLPDSIVAYPNKIPYSPIKKIFLGQQMGYNISLISSGEFTISIQQSNNSIKFISFPSTLKILDTTLLPIWFNIPNDATPGLYSFHLMINSNRNGYSTQIEITFQLLKPNASILIDFTHSGIVNEIFSVNTVNRLDDPWTASFLWGRYREFYIDMVDLNVSISLARSSNLENLTILEQYNILLIANPGTSLTGTFTDWWNDPVNFPSSTLITNVNSFTNSELSTLKSYVTNHGGNIQIFTSYPSMENITEVNRLLDVFNLTYIPTYVSQKVTIQNSSIFNLTNSIAIDYVGGLVNQSSGKYFEGHLVTPQELTQPIFAYWTSSTNGSLFVSGSAFFIELGLAEVSSHNYYENNLFYQILIANATKNYVIENPPFHPPSSSNSLISSSSTLSSISSFSSTIPTSSLMLLPFIIGLGIVYLSRKYRVK